MGESSFSISQTTYVKENVNEAFRNAMDMIIPVNVSVSYGRAVGNFYGVYDSTLSNCTFVGMKYDASREIVVLTDDVLKIDAQLEYVSSQVARIPTVATQEIGILKKDNLIIPQSEWEWNGPTTIKLLSSTFDENSDYRFTYEQKKEVSTPMLDVGVLPSEYDMVFDAYNYLFVNMIAESEVEMSQVVFFDSGMRASIDNPAIEGSGSLRDVSGNTYFSWSYVDRQTIEIDEREFKPDAVYVFTYKTKFRYVSYDGIEYYARYGRSYNSMSSWNKIQRGETLPLEKFYQFRLQVRAPIVKEQLRIRSIGVKKIKPF